VTNPEREGEPWKDEIVEEVRAAREKLLAECNFDLDALAERLRRQQETAGRSSVSFPRRVPAKEGAT
jgi:hypothetical protein